MDGDLIDYEDDGYVAPNMSYVPEGLDEHEVHYSAVSLTPLDIWDLEELRHMTFSKILLGLFLGPFLGPFLMTQN